MGNNQLLIDISPALRCQYTHYCLALTNKAIIQTNGLQPIRWIMTPVCPQCLSEATAAAVYSNGNRDKNGVTER